MKKEPTINSRYYYSIAGHMYGGCIQTHVMTRQQFKRLSKRIVGRTDADKKYGWVGIRNFSTDLKCSSKLPNFPYREISLTIGIA